MTVDEIVKHVKFKQGYCLHTGCSIWVGKTQVGWVIPEHDPVRLFGPANQKCSWRVQLRKSAEQENVIHRGARTKKAGVADVLRNNAEVRNYIQRLIN